MCVLELAKCVAEVEARVLELTCVEEVFAELEDAWTDEVLTELCDVEGFVVLCVEE